MSAALHLTKIAYGSESPDSLRAWLEGHQGEARLTTRYLPKREAELADGSLYWIHEHALVGRSPLIGFAQREDGRWWIRLEPRLIAVEPRYKRAHQGWRYLASGDAPPDLAPGTIASDALPPRLVGELAKLGLALNFGFALRKNSQRVSFPPPSAKGTDNGLRARREHRRSR